jgi:elongation factor 2
MKDLPKLVEVLRQVAKEDPTLVITINEETGEHLISGMGELHLEIITGRIKRDKGVEIVTSEPIVVYRETVTGRSRPSKGSPRTATTGSTSTLNHCPMRSST